MVLILGLFSFSLFGSLGARVLVNTELFSYGLATVCMTPFNPHASERVYLGLE
jgi:hypothetical protein